MKERRVISTVTLLSSLGAYFYAKHIEVDVVPLVMISGFFGALLGETLYQLFSQGDDDDKNPPIEPNF